MKTVPKVPPVPAVPRLCVFLLLVLGAVTNAQQLPDGPGAAIVTSRCVVCHESDIITSQRLSVGGWTNSINKMVRWGAQMTPQERDLVQAYLAAHFAPKAAVPAYPPMPQPVLATFRRACLACHDDDIVSVQRLSKAAWTREIEKMMRWGASINDAEKASLIDYLASNFGPR